MHATNELKSALLLPVLIGLLVSTVTWLRCSRGGSVAGAVSSTEGP